jgi:DNA-binding transcriptional LysR family regulator
MRPPIIETNVTSEIVFEESLVIALPATHALATVDAIDLRSLVREPFILFPRQLAPGVYDPIIAICQAAGFSPLVVQECIQMQTIVSLVSANMGVSIVPESIQQVQRAGVVYKPIQDLTPLGSKQLLRLATIAIVWRTNDDSPTVSRLLEIVKGG